MGGMSGMLGVTGQWRPMGRLNPAMARARRALGQYGLFWALIYTAWAVICNPRLKIPRSLRNRIPRLAGYAFATLGIEHLSVPVNGLKLYIDPRNFWSLREYVLQPHYDLAEISAVKRLVPASYTFIDIGANFGIWSFSLAQHFSRVVGVEPDKRCYLCCEKTLGKLHLENVAFVSAALAENDGEGLLFASNFHIGDSRIWDPGDSSRLAGTPVHLMSFNSLVGQQGVNSDHLFIKIDAQGVEPSIVRGMKDALVNAKDVILFTEIQQTLLADAGFSAREYLALLEELGFTPVDLFADLTETSWDEVPGRLATTRDWCFRLAKGKTKLSPQTRIT